MLCDQPALTSAHLDRLIDSFLAGAEIIASEYAGSLGVPALFSRSFFTELAALDPAQGAKPLLVKHANCVVAIPFPAGEIDIDTSEDYERLAG
jgi:molybdenum cofactor cytidylyltransferase